MIMAIMMLDYCMHQIWDMRADLKLKAEVKDPRSIDLLINLKVRMKPIMW